LLYFSFELIVQATESGNNPISSNATVRINVRVNCNANCL